jgi:hypothetical protein
MKIRAFLDYFSESAMSQRSALLELPNLGRREDDQTFISTIHDCVSIIARIPERFSSSP